MKLSTCLRSLPLLFVLTAVAQAQPLERFEIAGGGSVVGHVVDSNEHTIVVRDTTGRDVRIGRNVLRSSRLAIPENRGLAPDGSAQLFTLTDGSTVLGVVRSTDSAGVTVESSGGMTTHIPYRLIERQKPVILDERGEVVRSDPNRSRLFFAPTGRPLEAGRGYFSVSEIFFPMITFGVTDRLSISGGVSLMPGAEDQLLYFNVKATPVSTPSAAFSVGTFYMVLPFYGSEGIGIAYGVGTFGSERAAFTVGAGLGYTSEELAEEPVLMAGFDLEVSKSVKLLSENYFSPAAGEGFVSFGVRFFGDQLTGDFGLFAPTEGSNGFPFLPWLGFAYNF